MAWTTISDINKTIKHRGEEQLELYLGQVPDDKVWVVHVDDPWGSEQVWFLTAEASSQTYRDEERVLHFDDPKYPVTLTRWEVHLPRRGMDREDVDVFVTEALRDGLDSCRRLDIHATKIEAERHA